MSNREKFNLRAGNRLVAKLSEGFESAEISLRNWGDECDSIIAINVYPNGATISYHSTVLTRSGAREAGRKEIPRLASSSSSEFFLRTKDTRDYRLPDGRIYLYKDNPVAAIRSKLRDMRRSGTMAKSVLYIGTVNDPLSSVDRKLDSVLDILELLRDFEPAKIVFQTRSPMILSVLPKLKALGDRLVVALPVETCLENVLAKYTPRQSSLRQRLNAADGLRAQGIQVDLSVTPILPYGEFYRAAWDFAELLDQHADFVSLGCLATGIEAEERILRGMPMAQKLARDRQYQWLRPLAYRHLYHALEYICPAKLRIPNPGKRKRAQLDLFAA